MSGRAKAGFRRYAFGRRNHRRCDALPAQAKSEREQFDELATLLSEAIAETKRLLFRHFKIAPRTKRYKLFALMVLNDVLRKCESIDAMIRSNAHSGIEVLTRSAFESYADLINLLAHRKTYPDYMVYCGLNQLRSQLVSLGDPNNKFSAGFTRAAREVGRNELAEVRAQMAEAAGALPDLYKRPDGRVEDGERFKFLLAQKQSEYDYLYRHLSGEAHGRLYTMKEGIAHGGGFVWPPIEHEARPLAALDSLCAILIESAIRLARQFERPHETLKRLAQKREAIAKQGVAVALV